MGNTMMIVTGTAVTANFPTGNIVSPATTTINAGSVNQTLWSQQISISPRSVMLYGMTVKQIGSAPSNTLANVGLYIDGTLAGTATINANNQFVFSASSPVTLSTGSHLLEVRGDVVGGAFRNFYLSLEQGSDVALKDSQLGIFVAATSQGNTATNVNGGVVNVAQGTLTINQDSAFNNTTTLVGGAANVTMASFKFTSYGEDVKVTDLKFMPAIAGLDSTSAALNTLTNVGLYINGGQIGSNVTATNGSTLDFSNLGSQLLIPAGTPVTVSIKGDVIAGDVIANGDVNYASGTVSFGITNYTAQGMSSQQVNTVSSSVGGQALTISSSNVSFAPSTGFAATVAAPNSTNVKLGAFTLQTGSAEGVTINNVAVTFADDATNTLVHNNQLTNLTIMVNGAVVGTPIGQPVVATPNNFSVNIPVAISSSAEIDVYGTIGSSSTSYNVKPAMAITYRGTTSNLSATANAGVGVQTSTGTATIAQAGVTLVPSSSLSAQFVTGNGTSALQMATFNVVANNIGGAVLKDLTFTTTTNTIASVTVNGKTAPVVNNVAVVSNVGITVPSDSSGVNIPVSVQLVCIGQGCAGVSNSTVTLTLSGITYNNGSTVATVTPAPAVHSSNLALVGSVPTISMTGTSSSGLILGAQQIGTFTIGAGNTGDIKVQSIPFTITVGGSTASITAGSVFLYDANGNALNGAPTNNGLNGSGTFTFPTTGRTITKGTSETYTVYASVGGTLGTTTGSSSVTFALGAKGSFLWTDVVGSANGNNTGIQGTNIFNYPTTSQTKTN
jgi:hypothetical protein